MTIKKMTKWSLALIMGVGLIFASCTKDPGKDDGGALTGEDGYFTLKIKAEAASRATYNDAEGLPAEGKVNTIRVVLYNPSTMKVAYTWDFNSTVGTDDDNLYAKTGSQYTTIAQKVKRQAYKLLVLVNPPAIADLIAATTVTGADYTLFTAAQTRTTSDVTGSAADNFLMANFAGLVDVNVSSITVKKDDAYGVAVPVNVERAVAKVIVSLAPNFSSSSTGGTYTEMKWAVNFANKKMFWMRKQAPMADGTVETGDVADREIMYAIDPNYTGNSYGYYLDYFRINSTYPYTLPTDLADEFIAVAAGDVNTNMSTSDIPQYQYVLENTMNAPEQYTDVTTHVVLKAKFTPAKSSIDDAVIFASSDPYYVYNKLYVFSPAQIQSISAGTYTGWDDIVAANPMLENFQAFLQEADTKTAFSNNYTNPASTNISYQGLSYNQDGVNFYRILIRHFKDATQPVDMAYGRYGVVRNNIYNINVLSISGPGAIAPPKTVDPEDPEDPGDPEWPTEPDDNMGYVAVQIDVLPWYIRTQDAAL